MLNMDHLGTGIISEGLDFENYDDRINEEMLMLISRWAIDSGSTPFVSELFMGLPYHNGIPRFSRIYADMPSFSNTHYNDWVLGSEASDDFSTGYGNDIAYGGAGDDKIDGGEGEDAAYYTGPRNNYELVRNGDTIIVTAKEGNEGSDSLTNIERLIFSDTVEAVP